MGQAISEETVGMADKLYGARRAAKMMLGDRYTDFTKEVAAQVRDIVQKSPRNLSELNAAIELASAPGLDAQQKIVIFATAVDMTEGVI